MKSADSNRGMKNTGAWCLCGGLRLLRHPGVVEGAPESATFYGFRQSLFIQSIPQNPSALQEFAQAA